MSLTSKEVNELRHHIDKLERRIAELESNTRVVECQELHIVDAEGTPLISLSVNEEDSGEILIKSVSGKSGVQILGEKKQTGGGHLQVFKDFSETFEPFCLPRRDSVELSIEKEVFGGGGRVTTGRNHAPSVTLGSGYGYAGELSIQGEHDSECHGAGRIVLGVNRERDEGVILIQKPVYNADEDEYDMETITKIGNGRPPECRYTVPTDSTEEIES